MYSFFIGFAIFLCQSHGAKVTVCKLEQVDKNSAVCATYRGYGFCTATSVRLFMEQNCPVTCGFCQVLPPSTTSPPTSTQPPTTTMPPTTTVPPTTTPLPTTIPACTPNQVDIPTGQCIQYAKVFGFCTTSVKSIREFMFKSCPVSCGYCRGRRIPPTTPQQIITQAETTEDPSIWDKTTSTPTTQQQKTSAPTSQQPSTTWPTINMDLEAWKARCYNHFMSTAPSNQASFLDTWDTNTFIQAN